MNGESDSNSKNGNDGGATDNRTFRLQVEGSLAQRFVKAMEMRMRQLEISNAQDFKLSHHERKILMDVVTANLLEGAAAGLISFFVLRRFHVEYFKYVNRKVGFSGQTNTVRRPTSPDTFNSPYQQIPIKPQDSTNLSNAMENAATNTTGTGKSGGTGPPGWLFHGTSLLFDGIVSLYVAIFVSTRNPDKFLQQISEIPLMEGESVVSRELCPALLNEFQNIQNDLDDSARPTLPAIHANNKLVVRDAIAHPQTAVLQCMMKFCTNCRRRAAYEQILREQSGSTDAVIRIPAPGVPPDLDVTNDIAASMTGNVHPLSADMMTTEDIYNDSNFEDNTTTDVTGDDWTDREDERRK